jgi:hypothetical protein
MEGAIIGDGRCGVEFEPDPEGTGAEGIDAAGTGAEGIDATGTDFEGKDTAAV